MEEGMAPQVSGTIDLWTGTKPPFFHTSLAQYTVVIARDVEAMMLFLARKQILAGGRRRRLSPTSTNPSQAALRPDLPSRV